MTPKEFEKQYQTSKEKAKNRFDGESLIERNAAKNDTFADSSDADESLLQKSYLLLRLYINRLSRYAYF